MVNLETCNAAEASRQYPFILETPVVSSQASSGSSSSSLETRSLRLAMLCCEENPPYGPCDLTGKLFLELFRQTLQEHCSSNPETAGLKWHVSIAVYRAHLGQFPSDWDAYDGIILPGSFSAAYDTEPWIEKLKDVIQAEIVSKQRPTMGICFGHQVLAHSFAKHGGKAKKVGGGSRGGRRAMSTTKDGMKLFNCEDSVELYYTHGDMVETLPPSAVALGTEPEENLPVQSAAYFKDESEVQAFQSGSSSVKPYAITFQAHPEYAVSREMGLTFTLGRILNLMDEKGLISADANESAQADAIDNFDSVHHQSKDVFAASAKVLGWFP